MSPKTLFFVYFYQNPLNILGFDILWSLVSKYVKIYLFLFSTATDMRRDSCCCKLKL